MHSNLQCKQLKVYISECNAQHIFDKSPPSNLSAGAENIKLTLLAVNHDNKNTFSSNKIAAYSSHWVLYA